MRITIKTPRRNYYYWSLEFIFFYYQHNENDKMRVLFYVRKSKPFISFIFRRRRLWRFLKYNSVKLAFLVQNCLFDFCSFGILCFILYSCRWYKYFTYRNFYHIFSIAPRFMRNIFFLQFKLTALSVFYVKMDLRQKIDKVSKCLILNIIKGLRRETFSLCQWYWHNYWIEFKKAFDNNF